MVVSIVHSTMPGTASQHVDARGLRTVEWPEEFFDRMCNRSDMDTIFSVKVPCGHRCDIAKHKITGRTRTEFIQHDHRPTQGLMDHVSM